MLRRVSPCWVMELPGPLVSWPLGAEVAPGIWFETILHVCSFVRSPRASCIMSACWVTRHIAFVFRRPFAGVCHEMFCVCLPAVPTMPFVPFWGHSFRYGEALHPGPTVPRLIRLAVCNPTSVRGKEPDLVQLDADVICLSETSAVASVQHTVACHMSRRGFRTFFGQPVPPHAGEAATGFSVRGAAGGVAVMTKLPARLSPEPFPDALHVTTRAVECFLRFGPLEVRMITLYGVPSTHVDAKHANNALLQATFRRLAATSVPTLIAGDLNMDVTCLPVWQSFLALGYAEAHAYVAAFLGFTLPATCKGSTHYDTVLIPPLLQPALRHAAVLQDHVFDSHDPLLLAFECPESLPLLRRWSMPKPWTDFNLDLPSFAASYGRFCEPVDLAIQALSESPSHEATSQAFTLWATHLEAALDCTLATTHATNPLMQPQPGLPRAYRGRCRPLRHVARPCPQLPRAGRHGDYMPEVEGTSVRLRMR